MYQPLNSKNGILVIGDIMLDHYIYGDCNRISPEAPVPVVEVKKEKYHLGGAGNVLKNLLSLGATVEIISVTGDDDNANRIKNELIAANFSLGGIFTDVSRCTTTKSRVIVTNHQLIRFDNENVHPVDAYLEGQILDHFNLTNNRYNIVLISDYNKGLLTGLLLNNLFKTCREKNIKTIVDPKGSDFSKYRGATIIKPNKKEASLATGINIVNNDSLTRACDKIKQITACDYVIVTMSEDGIAIYSELGLSIIPTIAIAIVDVTGAGDTVLAALGVALASGNDIYSAAEFANHAAAIVINKPGSATVTMDEIALTVK